MDSTQNYLLNLLIEIDTICKKYDIEYFIDYGTTLGAVRHEGFIPWDDDIDINMTEENYYKWVEACKKELDPSKRVYGDNRLDRDFPGTFGRYIDVESLRISSHFAFWKPICGQSIDVFYLLELPGDPVKKQEMIDLYFAYDEYANSSYRHYRYKNDAQMKLYNKFCRMEKFMGKERVLRKLEKQLFNKHYDDCDTYIVTSARKYGPSSIAPKELYDTVYYADFEGHKFPISGRYAEMLTYYYGDNWNFLPNEKKHHSKMSHSGISCDDYVSDYMRLIDEKSMKKERQKAKHILVEEGYKIGKYLDLVHEKLGELALMKIEKKIKENNIDLDSLLDPSSPEKLATLDSIFSDYYERQLHSSVYYWENYLDIGERYFYAAVFNLIYTRNNFSAANKILNIRIANGYQPDEKFKKLWDVVLTVRKIKAEMVYKNYDEAEKLICEAIEKYPYQKEVQLYALEIKVVKNDFEGAEKLLEELTPKYPDEYRLKKALGDIAFSRGDKETADKYYDDIMKNSNNGLLHLDIRKKRGA
ncbi:MAG: LicD family protein [Ruminococcus sp.]|nr:LicD family protein [Ruminococcus sp.]